MNQSHTNIPDKQARLRLRALSFAGVEYELSFGDVRRAVVVPVGSGTSWHDATRFPSIGSDASETTGVETLDEEIRELAGQELVRLEATVLAMEERRAA